MAFQGWPEEALDFYEGLEADNSRTYWTRHKKIYEEKVLGPMTELLAELAAEFGDAKIFRPYRDVRFSKDKSPYKTNIGASVGSGYIQLTARGLAAGHGMYSMAPGQLERYREAVASDRTGEQLADVIRAVERRGISVHSRDSLKTAPRGYPADHRRIGLLRRKGLFAWTEWPVEPWLGTAAARTHIASFLVATRPLCAWLDTHAGATEAEGPATRR
jgi:uncharacterized protein (TIGR02453 family)